MFSYLFSGNIVDPLHLKHSKELTREYHKSES